MEDTVDKIKKSDEAFCFSCGSIIKKGAEICSKCGVNQHKRNETTQVEVFCRACGSIIKNEAERSVNCNYTIVVYDNKLYYSKQKREYN